MKGRWLRLKIINNRRKVGCVGVHRLHVLRRLIFILIARMLHFMPHEARFQVQISNDNKEKSAIIILPSIIFQRFPYLLHSQHIFILVQDPVSDTQHRKLSWREVQAQLIHRTPVRASTALPKAIKAIEWSVVPLNTYRNLRQ